MSTPTDEVIVRMRAALDELTASLPAGPPRPDDRPYTAEVVSLGRRRWPVLAALGAVAAAAAVAAVVIGTRGDDRKPSSPTPTQPATASTDTISTRPVAPSLPTVTIDLPGAHEDPSSKQAGSAEELPPTRIYAGEGLTPERVLVVQTKDAEFDPPSPEGDYTMDPIAAPTGEAWILHEVLDEPGHQTSIDAGVVWWSTGNGRELVVVSGQGFTDDELIAILPALHLDGDSWAWNGDLAEVAQTAQPPFELRSAQVELGDGQRVTIAVQTGSRWDLLRQSTIFQAVAARPGLTTLPDGTEAVVRADPGSYHVFWLEPGALVHLTVPISEDLDAILAAIRIAP
jgi:hypothetical protein